jgi:hypothetical protein
MFTTVAARMFHQLHMVYSFVNDYVLLLLLYTLEARKHQAIQVHIFKQMKNSAQAVNLDVKAQHTIINFDCYKIRLYNTQMNRKAVKAKI